MAPQFDAHLTAEATDHLAQLDTLLAQQGTPDPQRMLNLATALRQTAQLADADTVAAVAERLEDTARSLIDRNFVWSDEIRWLAQQSVADLRLVLRALDRWGETEEDHMRRVLARWDESEHPEALPKRQGVPFAADPGYRERLARAQSGESSGTGDSIPGISSFFFDDAGPHVIEEGVEDAEDEESPLPMLGELPDFGEARIGLDAAFAPDADATPAVTTPPSREPTDALESEVEAEFEMARHRFETTFEGEGPEAEGPEEEESEIVDIGALLYRGDGALREARALEPRIRAALRGEADDAEGLVAELFDLLELATDRGEANG